MRSVLITGGNRGIGLGIVKKLIQGTKFQPEFIFATCRDVSKATELKTLADSNPKLHIIEIDLNNVKDYNKVFEAINEKVGDAGLNLLINNAGVSTKFTRLGLVKEEQLKDNFAINTIAPIMLTQKLLPLLKKGAKIQEDKPMSVSRAAIVNISSILGSIAQNDSGGYYPYRCSKSALNAATKSMSVDLKENGILAVCVHPGWVKTDMGGSQAPLEIENSVEDILNTLQNLKAENTGTFLQHDGTTLPW
ncbi:C-factor [Leptopilina boulardi]|uniref:C-factor n=1 Tax=Leptopilina boulardi TaxID=63433 RepID=UPI0021F60DB1|nr:C-factor [Leptopilina boulardi]